MGRPAKDEPLARSVVPSQLGNSVKEIRFFRWGPFLRGHLAARRWAALTKGNRPDFHRDLLARRRLQLVDPWLPFFLAEGRRASHSRTICVLERRRRLLLRPPPLVLGLSSRPFSTKMLLFRGPPPPPKVNDPTGPFGDASAPAPAGSPLCLPWRPPFTRASPPKSRPQR